MTKEEILKFENIIVFCDPTVGNKPHSRGFIVGFDESSKEGDIITFLITNAVGDIVEESVKVVSYLHDLDMDKTLVITNGHKSNFDYSFDKLNMYFDFIKNYKHYEVSETPDELFKIFNNLQKIEKEIK